MSAGPQAADRPPPLRPLRSDGWSDTWREWRNRLLTSARFRRWAAAFPLTRPIARARAAEVFDLVAGFVYSQVLAAALQLRLLDRLADGPSDTATLARAMALPEMQADRLLAACAALGLAERRSGGRWGLGPRGAALVGEPGLAALVAHHAALYHDLADPVALLRRGGDTHLNAYWPYASHADGTDPAGLADGQVARYSELMTASQPMVAEQVLDAVNLRGARCLLDVGGGEGAFVQAVAARAPHLKLMLFDLPAVADRAHARLARLDLAGRVQVHGGNFLRDALPRGADVISLVRVVHDHDDEAIDVLLRAARAALPTGGRLLVAEPMAGTPGAAAMGDAYFGIYLLAMRSGRPRTPERLTDMLRHAGFGRVRQVRTHQPLLAGVIEATVHAG